MFSLKSTILLVVFCMFHLFFAPLSFFMLLDWIFFTIPSFFTTGYLTSILNFWWLPQSLQYITLINKSNFKYYYTTSCRIWLYLYYLCSILHVEYKKIILHVEYKKNSKYHTPNSSFSHCSHSSHILLYTCFKFQNIAIFALENSPS